MQPIPTINVNLSQCSCPNDLTGRDIRAYGKHVTRSCAAYPVLVPLPLHRSFTATVVLGECNCTIPSWWTSTATEHAALESKQGRAWTATSGCACGPCQAARRAGWLPGQHNPTCPARPIRVSCTISGSTWEASEVAEWDAPIGYEDVELMRQIRDVCRDRWALVKALVLGESSVSGAHGALLAQRSAVFAALADMARAEAATLKAEEAFHVLFPACPPEVGLANVMGRGSTQRLAAYMERLIEQVGNLGVES